MEIERTGDLGLRNMSPNSNPRDIEKLHSKKGVPSVSPKLNQACAIACAGTPMGGIQGTLLSMGVLGLRDW